MAKKTVTNFKSGEGGRTYSKVIKMVKSPKTGVALLYTQLSAQVKLYSRKLLEHSGGHYLFSIQIESSASQIVLKISTSSCKINL